MRIYLVVDETRFYQPNFVAKFLKKTTDNVVGAALVVKVSPKNNIELYLKRHWHYLKFSEVTKMVFGKYAMAIKDLLGKKGIDKPFYSVRSVLKFSGIDFIEVENDINKKIYLDKIKAKQPDVLISSNSLIFKDELLKMPKICCLNRHSALLPSYGGLWPVFQAYRSGEKYVGVSVNIMKRDVDGGAILAQNKVRIEDNDTIAKLYYKCFEVSVDVLLEALEKVKKDDFTPCQQDNPPSYFSFPTKEHWQDFRKRGGRFI